MSPRTAVRRVVAPHTEGTLVRMLSLPARLHLRWLVIVLMMVVAIGLYAHVLTTASPMPPSKAPEMGSATSSPPPPPSPVPS